MPDLSPYQNASSGGETYFGVAVSYDPNGTVIDAPSVAPTATGAGTGGTLPAAPTPGYQYKVGFVGGTPAGETTPSAASTGYVATGSTSSVALSVIPLGGTGTTARTIYRADDGVNFFLIHTLADNTTTTWTDDGSAALQGFVPRTDNTTNIGAPGLAPAPTQYIPITDDNLSADWDQAQPKTMSGSELTDAIMEPTRLDEKGDITWLTNPALGPLLIQAHLGGYTTINSSSATSTGPVATANGVSVIPVTGSFVPGMMVDVGTDPAKERTLVIAYTAGSLTTYELSEPANAHSSGSMTVAIPQQKKYARSILSRHLRKRIPLLCGENGAGAGDWAWAFRDMAVDQLDFTFNDKESTIKTGFVGSAEPLYYSDSGLLPDGVTAADGVTNPYNPNADDEAVAKRPLTSRNCYLAAYGDPGATGSSTVRAAIGATNVQISSKAALKKYAPMNGGNSYTYFRVGSASCEITLEEVMTSLRPDVWYDAIKLSKAVSLIMGVWDNFGTLSAKSFKGLSVYVPQMKYKTDTRTTKIGDVDMARKSAQALSGVGVEDYIQVFVAS